MASVMVGNSGNRRTPAEITMNSPAASSARALTLATGSLALSFAAWGLIGGLASVLAGLYQLTASQTALLVAVPVGFLRRLERTRKGGA